VRAVVIHETGGPEVLRVEEVPDPEPGEGEVLVRVAAIGVNHYDVNQRAGGATSFPSILGGDAAGRHGDTGELVAVTGAGGGCYAELVVVPETNVTALPDGVDDATAAALGVPYRVAWAMAKVSELAQGETLLVQSGSSATGQACVDVGHAVGAKVYATASASKLDKLAAIGAEPLAYDDPRVEELGVDVVFDPVGADTFGRSLKALRAEGRLATSGALSSPVLELNVWSIVGKRLRIIGFGAVSVPLAETMQRLVELAAAGDIRPAIDRELPLEQAAEAHRAIEARETFGKIILRP